MNAAAATKTVLFCAHSSALYGSQKSLLDLLLHMTGVNVVVTCPRRGPFTDLLAERGIRHLIVPYRGWTSENCPALRGVAHCALNALAARRVRARLQGTAVDAVYTNTGTIPIGGLLARRLRRPHLWHLREDVEGGINRRYDFGRRRALAWMNAHADQVICNSAFVRSTVEPYVDPEKLIVVYNGVLPAVDPATLTGRRFSSTPPLKLCMVGAVTPERGHEDTIRAMGCLRRNGLASELTVVGSGETAYRDRLLALAAALGIAGDIRFVGYRDKPLDAVAASDITVVATRREAFGRVAVEAASVACPVIATDCGGLVEIIEDGATGLLYQAGDHEMLAKQIRRLVDDPRLYEQLARDGQAAVYRRFTTERYVHELAAIIDRWLDPGSVKTCGGADP